MSDLKSFSFFESYFSALKKLPPKKIGEVVLAMGEYFFEDKEIPECDGITGVALELIRPTLCISKAKALSGKKGGESKTQANAKQTPSKPEANLKQMESKVQANRKQTASDKGKGIRIKDKNKDLKTPLISPLKKSLEDIVKEKNLPLDLENKILEWLKYKTERKEAYKETGLNALITEIRNNVDRYGMASVIECINKSMSRGYRGIIFEMIKPDQKGSNSGNVTSFNPTEYLLQQIREEESANG